MDNIYAIIPVSKFKNAKTRLSPFLSEKEREKLLKVMLQDVTDTLKRYVDKIFIIVPSKGGGTNMMIMKPMGIHTKFEGFSYKEHVKAAERKKLNPQVHDSFFMALDVNTAEDLGEIMIHGEKTHTRKYLKELKVKFEPSRGSERINVTRSD